MPHRTFNPEELAEYLHLTEADIERLLRESDIPCENRGGRWVFRRSAIDAWISKRILQAPKKRLDVYHAKTTRGTQEQFPQSVLVPELMKPAYIDLGLTAKTAASVIRDVVALAARSGRVNDPRELTESVSEREALCSTALPGGLALLHTRHHEPYRFDGSFVVLGRTVQDIHFGAPDGRPTRLFFLLCCEDDRIHLHTLARFSIIVSKTKIVERLFASETPAEAFEALQQAERAALGLPEVSA